MADGLCRLTPLPTQSGSWQVFMMEIDDIGSQEEGMLPPRTPPSPGNIPPVVPPHTTQVDGQPHLPADPEVIHIALHKVKGSMGLSIVAAKVCISYYMTT